MKKEILESASRTLGTAGLALKKHSPAIFVTAGIIGGVVGAVMACKATVKVKDIIEEKDECMEKIARYVATDNVLKNKEGEVVEYTEERANKDALAVYAQTGLKLAKLYAPAVGVGVLSIASIAYGHRILSKRNMALASAYALLDTGFKNYRSNVVERFGKELDNELRYNIKVKEIDEVVVDKDGNEKVEKKTVKYVDMNPNDKYSVYARFFDESCNGHQKNAEYNLMFIRAQQDYANKVLRSRGYIFLNDVYKLLGMQPTKAGQSVGWVYKKDNTDGDNYVDFFIYDNNDERKRAFVNGQEYNILLDFNVDGNILDKLPLEEI